MKKAAFIAVIALVLTSCGGASHENCTDCNTTDSVGITETLDSVKLDSTSVGHGVKVTPAQ